MFRLIVYLYLSVMLPILSLAQSFYLTSQPDPIVLRSSIQTITWKSSLPLQEVEVDLYQTSRFIKKLGETNKNSGTFAWQVGDNPICGKNYFIKVSVLSTNNTRAWANTDTFQICDTITFNMLYLCFIIIVPILCCVCYQKKRSSYTSHTPLATPLPITDQTTAAATYPPAAAVCPSQTTTTYPAGSSYPAGTSYPTVVQNPVVVQERSRSGFGTAAAGFAAGFLADELLHSGGHHHHHHSSVPDFGGGDFGTSDFGGDGGDSSGGFS